MGCSVRGESHRHSSSCHQDLTGFAIVNVLTSGSITPTALTTPLTMTPIQVGSTSPTPVPATTPVIPPASHAPVTADRLRLSGSDPRSVVARRWPGHRAGAPTLTERLTISSF